MGLGWWVHRETNGLFPVVFKKLSPFLGKNPSSWQGSMGQALYLWLGQARTLLFDLFSSLGLDFSICTSRRWMRSSPWPLPALTIYSSPGIIETESYFSITKERESFHQSPQTGCGHWPKHWSSQEVLMKMMIVNIYTRSARCQELCAKCFPMN